MLWHISPFYNREIVSYGNCEKPNGRIYSKRWQAAAVPWPSSLLRLKKGIGDPALFYGRIKVKHWLTLMFTNAWGPVKIWHSEGAEGNKDACHVWPPGLTLCMLRACSQTQKNEDAIVACPPPMLKRKRRWGWPWNRWMDRCRARDARWQASCFVKQALQAWEPCSFML